MKGLKCPHCNEKAIGLFAKLSLGARNKIACNNCKNYVSVPFYKTLVSDSFFLIILVFLADYFDYNVVAIILLLMIDILIAVILHLHWINLIPVKGNKFEEQEYNLNKFLNNINSDSS